MLSRIGTPALLVSTTFLALLGLVMVFSASALSAELRFGNSWMYVVRQLGGLGIGVVAAFGLSRMPLQWIHRISYPAWVVGVLLLLAVFTPLGYEANGARRWPVLGGVTVQPLELVKLGVVLALARWLANNPQKLRDYRVAVLIPGVSKDQSLPDRQSA